MPTINDYDYYLPPGLIAQEPCPQRDQARLLVLDRAARTLAHSHFHQLPQWLSDQTVLVINDTRVFPVAARWKRFFWSPPESRQTAGRRIRPRRGPYVGPRNRPGQASNSFLAPTSPLQLSLSAAVARWSCSCRARTGTCVRYWPR